MNVTPLLSLFILDIVYPPIPMIPAAIIPATLLPNPPYKAQMGIASQLESDKN